MQRWELNYPDPTDAATFVKYYTDYVNAELNEIGKFRDVTFSDNTFNQKVHDYIDALDKQLKSLDYYATDTARSQADWSSAYKQKGH